MKKVIKKEIQKKLFVLFTLLCVIMPLFFQEDITYAASTNIEKYLTYLGEIEQVKGYSDQNLLFYIDGRKNEFTDQVDEEYPECSFLKDKTILSTMSGEINILQLLKGRLQKSSLKDYITYAGSSGSIEYLTAIDEYNMRNEKGMFSEILRNYYSEKTKTRKITDFVQELYHPSTLQRDHFLAELQKINQKMGITDNSNEYLYREIEGGKIQDFTISCKEELPVGKKIELGIIVRPWNVKYSSVSYTCDNDDVAEIKNGYIYGKKEGETTIYANVNGKKTEKKVKFAYKIDSITDQTKETEVMEGDRVQMKFSINPSSIPLSKLNYKTSNDYVATVDKQGKVSFKHRGHVTITAYMNEKIKVEHEFSVLSEMTGISIEKEIDLLWGTSKALEYEILPMGLTEKNVKFASEDASIVSVDQNGVITAKQRGSTIITITSKRNPKITAKTKVTVVFRVEDILPEKNQVYYIGHNEMFRYQVSPSDAQNPKLRYEVQENEYASVDRTGDIIPKKIGQADLTVYTTDGSNKKKTVTIYIRQAVEKISVKNKIYLKIGESFHLYYTVAPSNASVKTVTITPENEKVAVSGDRVTAKGYGKTKVTLTANDGMKATTECYIVVRRPFWHYLLFGGCIFGGGIVIVQILKKKRTKENKN